MDVEKVLALNDIGLKKVYQKFVANNKMLETMKGIKDSGVDYITL